jgi:hypothetical protein
MQRPLYFILIQFACIVAVELNWLIHLSLDQNISFEIVVIGINYHLF